MIFFSLPFSLLHIESEIHIIHLQFSKEKNPLFVLHIFQWKIAYHSIEIKLKINRYVNLMIFFLIIEDIKKEKNEVQIQ